jgi:hypothetical protein
MQQSTSTGSDVFEENGLLIGSVRAVTMRALPPPASEDERWRRTIHEEEMAHQLGFRGAVIGAPTHLNQFPPVLMRAFGREWWETGSLSLYFENTVVDGEQVQVVAESPAGSSQVRTWARFAEDHDKLVAAGTASIGGDTSRSELHTRDLRACDPTHLKFFGNLHPGQVLADAVAVVPSAEQRESLATHSITEPLAWYTGDSPWGGPIATPAAVATFIRRITGDPYIQFMARDRAAGMWGATEFGFVHGPMLLDVPYRARSVVVALGESPKTEYCWFDVTIEDESGRLIATQRALQRLIKASSPLYAGGQAS